MLKLLQEIRGFAHITNRRPPPKSPALALTQLRSHVFQATLPKRRLNVRTDVAANHTLPHPVKINHIKENPAPLTRLPAG
jgi:hypothetical protein